MYTVYVLFSETHHKIYVGYTSDMNERLKSHNELGKHRYTTKYRPWMLLYTEEFESKASAMKREMELKSAQGRLFIWNIVNKRPGL